jgi:hypothetical protein
MCESAHQHRGYERFLARSNRITEVRLTPSCLAICPLTDPVLAKLFHFWVYPAVIGRPMRFPVLSGLIDSRLYPVPQNIPFEFRGCKPEPRKFHKPRKFNNLIDIHML